MIEMSFVEELEKNKKLTLTIEEMRVNMERHKEEYVKLAPLRQLVKEKEGEIAVLEEKLGEVKRVNSEMLEEEERLKQEIEGLKKVEERRREM